MLLRRLQSDQELIGVSHVVVDEVHERSGKRMEQDAMEIYLQHEHALTFYLSFSYSRL